MFGYPWLTSFELALGRGDLRPVRLWLADLGPAYPELDRFAEMLDPLELAQANRFHFERDRTAFILRRGLLRCLLGQQLGCPPKHVVVHLGCHGKPEIPGGGRLRFNASHSGQLALLGFTQDREVGVDVEEIRPARDLDALAARIFAPAELKSFLARPRERQLDTFYQSWTRKEAVVKAFGVGLSLEPQWVEVGLPKKADPRGETVVECGGHGRSVVVSFQPRAGYWAAVAVTL